MKLTQTQKGLLLDMGCPQKDFAQIEAAASKTTYWFSEPGYAERRISRAKAIELLGEKEFFSGLARAAFHRTAIRYRNAKSVLFDCSRFFKDE